MPVDLSRRDWAWMTATALSAAAGQQFFAGWLQAAQQNEAVHHGTEMKPPPEPDRWRDYKPRFFSAEEFKVVERYTEILIPTDDTPGAREAHVAEFIDFVVNAAAEHAPEMQEEWRSAMIWLTQKGFAQLSASQQVELVRASAGPEFDKKAKHEGFAGYKLIKDMTIRAFYTSRAGLVDALEYKGIAYLAQFPGCTHAEHRRA